MEYGKTFLILWSLQLVRYSVFAGGAYFLLRRRTRAWLERHRIQPIALKRSDLLREISYSMGTILIFPAIFAIVHTPSVRVHTLMYSGWREHGLPWLVLSFVLLVLLHDTYFYWMHRLLHRPVFFKAAHRVHHLSRNPSPFAAYSFHPLEAIFESIWMLPLMFLMPLHISALAAFTVFSLANNVIGHLSVEIYPESWRQHPVLGWLNTATCHARHHSKFNGNYGLYFMFWDRLMGTELCAAPGEARLTPVYQS